jgi:hypothetical protein
MKKITLLMIAAIALMGTTSCRKPRTCTCTDAYGGYETSTIVTTKKKAKEYCDNLQNSYGSGVTCTLE